MFQPASRNRTVVITRRGRTAAPAPPTVVATKTTRTTTIPKEQAFADMQRDMEAELEQRRQDWEREINDMQKDFFNMNTETTTSNGGQGPTQVRGVLWCCRTQGNLLRRTVVNANLPCPTSHQNHLLLIIDKTSLTHSLNSETNHPPMLITKLPPMLISNISLMLRTNLPPMLRTNLPPMLRTNLSLMLRIYLPPMLRIYLPSIDAKNQHPINVKD